MQVFDHRAKAKLAALKKNVSEAAREGVKDAGAFLKFKLVDQIINSPGNAAQGGKAPQPPHDLAGGRFIRRRTGFLVGSMKMEVIRAGAVRIYSKSGKGASYAPKVIDWSYKRYGRSFYTICVQMYGKTVERIFTKEVTRAVHSANNLASYSYENHYPIT